MQIYLFTVAVQKLIFLGFKDVYLESSILTAKGGRHSSSLVSKYNTNIFLFSSACHIFA